ncbi:MAG: group III truncated hemoglobin [Kordiimonas sp.]
MEANAQLHKTADRPYIYKFVTAFYSTVRKDPAIGPIFDEAIGDHWDQHFETLTDFWMTVLLGVHTYKGNPFLVHKQLPTLKDEHFDIWLGIFEEVARDQLYPELAEIAVDKAGKIASSLRQGLFYRVAS